MHVENLTLELTRKCNLTCEHCIRGCAQRKSMDRATMLELFYHVKSVDTLSIGGGEPSLAIQQLEDLLEVLELRDVEVNHIFLVTNGKRVSVPLLKAYAALYEYCTDNDLSSFSLSNDLYHQEAREGVSRNIHDYIYACEDNNIFLPEEIFHYHTQGKIHLIKRGRAKHMLSAKDEPYLDNLRLNNLQHPTRIYGDCYIAYNGDVIGDANASYADMKKLSRGNIHNWNQLLQNLEYSTYENFMWCSQNCRYCGYENYENNKLSHLCEFAQNLKEENTCGEWLTTYEGNFDEYISDLLAYERACVLK